MCEYPRFVLCAYCFGYTEETSQLMRLFHLSGLNTNLWLLALEQLWRNNQRLINVAQFHGCCSLASAFSQYFEYTQQQQAWNERLSSSPLGPVIFQLGLPEDFLLFFDGNNKYDEFLITALVSNTVSFLRSGAIAPYIAESNTSRVAMRMRSCNKPSYKVPQGSWKDILTLSCHGCIMML